MTSNTEQRLKEEQAVAQAEWDAMATELGQIPQEHVTFKSANQKGDCPAVLHGNLSKTDKGLIVIQEWWGLTDFMLREGREFALKGNLVTLIPDLYRGAKTQDYEEASHMMSTLDWEGAVQDIQGATDYLLERGCKKVGVTGFCMGGALSLAAAARVTSLSASAPFYGIPKPELADLRTIRIPMQCHFGLKDEIAGFSNGEAQQILRKILDSGNVNYEFCEYPNGRHAFMDYTFYKFDFESRMLALRRLFQFLSKTLSK